MSETESFIIVVNPAPPVGREIRGIQTKSQKIPVSTLAENAKVFLADLSSVFADIESELKGFELDEIEVAATLTSSGHLSILGIGGDIGSEGSFKFTFKKKRQ